MGHKVESSSFFDTVTVSTKISANLIVAAGVAKHINLRLIDNNKVSITLDETVSKSDLEDILSLFSDSSKLPGSVDEIAVSCGISSETPAQCFDSKLQRTSKFLTHPIFNSYHSETEILRYIYYLQKKDLSLADAMIPLGSCTMKLNSTVEMIPVTFPEFGSMHPFVPKDQAVGYSILIKELEYALSEATGYQTICLQPNSGAQGEYTGLRVIQAYHESIGQGNRNICLIPVSAHGTNPASASMCNLNVVTVKCDEFGNLDLKDLKEKAEKHKSNLAAIMITYPSTFGVFEENIKEVCKIIHDCGGQVYMDGANLNAQMGLCKPGEIGADVCHLNLHKTFCIPHGGGGPGMGPIGVADHLKPFLPGHPLVQLNHKQAIGPVSAAPWGSASILPISWAYLKMMGDDGLRKATQVAILNANYMLARLKDHYKILYTNKKGFCAHEFIVDCRDFQKYGVEAVDIAKRLHDYGFHSPTMSFPVANTLMIEPTESESLAEIDRFCNAMIQIRKEIDLVVEGKQPKDNNVLTNAPHSIQVLTRDTWDRPYSREMAAYPVPDLRKNKFWPSISRVDDTYGDRNLVSFANSDLFVPSYRRLSGVALHQMKVL
jgi:glycine dehydrogenase